MVTEVFGARNCEKVYSQIEDLLRDKKMVGQKVFSFVYGVHFIITSEWSYHKWSIAL